jgi:hypothetical protein
MKKLIQLILPVFVVLAFASCDKVEGPYKKNNTGGGGNDTTLVRKVFVEDYTGHKCGNCPRAAKAVYDLKAIYGDRLIIMGVHAGTFATVFPVGAPYYTYDFRTPVGNELDTDFGISNAGNPNGMVNRRQVNGSYIVSSTQWADEVATVLSSTDPVPASITIGTTYNSVTRELQADISTKFFEDLTGTYRLSVYMLEDSIVNWQKDYDVTPNDVPDYVHREVLRGSMNGTYGDVVASTAAGSESNFTFNAILGTDWNENKMYVVAFLHNDATKEIIQVEQKHVEP